MGHDPLLGVTEDGEMRTQLVEIEGDSYLCRR